MERITFPAIDGQLLRGRLFEPDGRADLTFLVAPGIGVPQRLFRHVAGWLATQGARAITFDYRGIGESSDRAAIRGATLSTWAERDLVGALRYAANRSGDAPVALLAHSFGGQALAFADELRRFDSAILVGSQLGHPHHWSGIDRLKLEVYWRLVLPVAAALFERTPKSVGLGARLPRGVAREWARWGRARDWSFSHVEGNAARCARFDRPLLAIGVSDDALAPPRSVDDLLSRFENAPIERVEVSPEQLGAERVGHFGLFHPELGASLWPEWLAFARRQVRAPLLRRSA